jgi:acyl carrier protein
MQEEVCQRVCRCAASAWNMDQAHINKDSSMDTIPQWDSLGHLKLIMALEKEFGLTFHPRDTVRMQSIDKICQIIEAVKT